MKAQIELRTDCGTQGVKQRNGSTFASRKQSSRCDRILDRGRNLDSTRDQNSRKLLISNHAPIAQGIERLPPNLLADPLQHIKGVGVPLGSLSRKTSACCAESSAKPDRHTAFWTARLE